MQIYFGNSEKQPYSSPVKSSDHVFSEKPQPKKPVTFSIGSSSSASSVFNMPINDTLNLSESAILQKMNALKTSQRLQPVREDVKLRETAGRKRIADVRAETIQRQDQALVSKLLSTLGR